MLEEKLWTCGVFAVEGQMLGYIRKLCFLWMFALAKGKRVAILYKKARSNREISRNCVFVLGLRFKLYPT